MLQLDANWSYRLQSRYETEATIYKNCSRRLNSKLSFWYRNEFCEADYNCKSRLRL